MLTIYSFQANLEDVQYWYKFEKDALDDSTEKAGCMTVTARQAA